jgi:hypothetical protein
MSSSINKNIDQSKSTSGIRDKFLGVPVMVHTGSGAPFADPISLIGILKYFKDMKIVLAHAGSDLQ